MTTPNETLIHRMFDEMINQRRVEVLDELFDPEFTSHTPMGVLDREGFRGFVTGWLEAFPDMVNEVSQFLEQDDHVSWTIRATGTHTGAPFMGIPASGRKIDFLSMNHGVVKDGRGFQHWVVMDILTMLQQLGVVPEMQGATA